MPLARRQFLKRGALFIPAGFVGRRMIAQNLNLADGPFLASIGKPVDPVASDWAARVVANGGSLPSGNSIAAVSDFVTALKAASIDTKMISVLVYAPDSLIAALTPVYKVAGSDPWVNHNFVAGDLTINGLIGNGDGNGTGTKYLTSGCVPDSVYTSDGDCGLTVYAAAGSGGTVSGTIGAGSNSFNVICGLKLEQANTTYFECFDVVGTQGSGFRSFASTGFFGFVSGNRTSPTAGAVYQASSTVPFVSKGALSGLEGNRPVLSTTGAGGIYCHVLNIQGSPVQFDRYRLSLAAIHHGLTSAQAQPFYNASQAIRTAFGGGFV